jgi:hypothetical protein
MTAYEYEQIKRKLGMDAKNQEFLATLAWEKRHNAAMQAARTKRSKYTSWPTRAGKHQLKP